MQGAIREVEEELGIQVVAKDLNFIKTLKHALKYTATFINNGFDDLYILRTNKIIEDFNFQKEELQDLFFVSYMEFKKLASDLNSDLLKHTDEFEILFNMFDAEFNK